MVLNMPWRNLLGLHRYMVSNMSSAAQGFPKIMDVERTVQTVKQLLKHSSDPDKSLLNYRSTPFPWCGRIPSELLMGRHLQTSLPHTETQIRSAWSYLQEFRQKTKCSKNDKRKISIDTIGHGSFQRFLMIQKLWLRLMVIQHKVLLGHLQKHHVRM